MINKNNIFNDILAEFTSYKILFHLTTLKDGVKQYCFFIINYNL